MDRFRPDSWFRPAPGTAGTIHSRTAIRDWYLRLAAETERLRAITLGTSTEGNPIDALFIADDMSNDAFDRLARSRLDELQPLLSGKVPNGPAQSARPVVLITSGIHATEIGGPQSIPELVHWLVASEYAVPTSIRERVITIIVPTLNPDGMDLVHRWNASTVGTEHQGTLPPLLYHRFAGHDNNRDWLFRNLAETRVLLDTIHRQWLPHITLDQHQMGKFGPRFVLPPYCDPWDPLVPPAIIAGSNALGQSIATDMALQGFSGVQTNRYFDAWEPSRAIQHYRGGIRILTEGASANLAHPIEVSEEQLLQIPMPMPVLPTGGQPRPWPGGTWTLREIVDRQIAAAQSLLATVALDPDRWIDVQRQALSDQNPSKPPVHYHIDTDLGVGDPGAQYRLASMMAAASALSGEPLSDDEFGHVDGMRPLSRLAHAVVQPMSYPDAYGPSAYDLTSHHVPMMMGALVQASTESGCARPAENRGKAGTESGKYVAIDARSHQAPMLIERASRDNRPVWRTSRAQMVDRVLIQPGSWIVELGKAEPTTPGAMVSSHRISTLPSAVSSVTRRDVVLLSISDQPAADYGWTRLWLHQRGIPFLETRAVHLGSLKPRPEDTVLLLPEDGLQPLSNEVISLLDTWLEDGGNVTCVGKTARGLVPTLAPDIAVIDGESHPDIKAPGAILRLLLDQSHPASRGLDSSMPATYASDGAFQTGQSRNASIVARFAQRDTVVSGWMAGAEHVASQAAVLEFRHKSGTLVVFSFRPLFRAQMLVTSPLFHNLLYQPNQENITAP